MQDGFSAYSSIFQLYQQKQAAYKQEKANNKWQSLWQKHANSNNSEWKIDRGGEGGEGEESEEDPVPI